MKNKKVLATMMHTGKTLGLSALLAACAWLLPGQAAAEDIWVYRGYDDVDYYLKDETIQMDGDDWIADVELVEDGRTKFVAPFRFHPTGNWDGDIEERAVSMWWKSKKQWIDMGLSSKDPLAQALWVDGLLPYVGGNDAEKEEDGAGEAVAEDGTDGGETAAATEEQAAAQPAESVGKKKTKSKSPAVTDARAHAAYWIARNPNGERVLFTPEEIASINDAMRGETSTLRALATEPAADGVRYGVATRRGNLRLTPVPPDGSHYDEQQATAVDPCEPLLVYEDSDDGRFSHVVMRNYEGWLSKRAFALTDCATWMQFAAPKEFAVVTANRWKLYDESAGKTATYQMGAKIPLARAPLRGRREKAVGTLSLLVPSRAPDGTLILHMQPAVFDDDLHHGFLPCTENNFVRQGFRFLGDVYGWGGLDDSVDCSAFTSDVYRSMGLEIPRDADVQGQALPYRVALHGKKDARLALLTIAFPIGTLLSNDTHVMMYIGQDADGTPMVLQAMSSYVDETGKHYLRQVVLTTLTYPNSAGNPYIDGVKYLSAIK